MGFDELLSYKSEIDAAEAQFVKSCTPEKAIEAWEILNMILTELGDKCSEVEQTQLLSLRDQTRRILRENNIHKEPKEEVPEGKIIDWAQVVRRMKEEGGDFVDDSKGVTRRKIEKIVLGETDRFKDSQWNNAENRNTHLKNNGKLKAGVRYFVGS